MRKHLQLVKVWKGLIASKWIHVVTLKVISLAAHEVKVGYLSCHIGKGCRAGQTTR